VSLTLAAGVWELETPYQSPLQIEVNAPGLHTTLPANLDRPGPRWPIGRISLAHAGTVGISFQAIKHRLSPASDVAVPGSLIATPLGSERLVPLQVACGKLVDWYRSP
jgi:hypothetical protein